MAFTFFFRDAQTLELAIGEALPSLRGRLFIHVWDAGCAHGPEPYTLAMLLRERMSDYVFRNVHIHATDVDASFAPKVTTGVFADHEVKPVRPRSLASTSGPLDPRAASRLCRNCGRRSRSSHHDLLSLRPIREGLS